MPQPISSPASTPREPCRIDASAVLDHLDMAVLVVNREGEVLYRNLQAHETLAEGGNLQSVFSMVHFRPENHWRIKIAQALSSFSATNWTSTITAESTRHMHIRCAPLSITDAREPLAVLYVEDLGKAGAEAGDDVSRRLTSLGKLAARVAHELNNPLDGILRYVNLAIRVAGDPPESRLNSYLSESRSGLLRMIRIIGDLLEFSRSSEADLEETSVNDAIEQAIKACSTAADANRVIVSADFQSENMPSLRGSRFYQVCCNLIRNAIDAMPDGGRLSIASGLLEDCVVLRVTDTGIGLPEPIEKIFEPFYTTKQPGKGTGLGLAICKEFVEEMGGSLAAINTDSGGAMFTVRIPITSFQSPRRITR